MDNIVWAPKQPEQSQMSHFMRFVESRFNQNFQQDYDKFQCWSVEQPAKFWQSLSDFFHIRFDKPPTSILEKAEKMIDAQWFKGAEFNFAEKLLQADGKQLAIIEINESGQRNAIDFSTLRQKVADCAAALKASGINAGDRIAGVLPNCAATIIAMLASTSIGAVWSSCSPDFGTSAIIDRLGQIQPDILFICNGHQYQGKTFSAEEKINALAEAMPDLKHIVLLPFLNGHQLNQQPEKLIFWDDFVIADSELEFHPQPFDHPLYIMFSSGTTGKPKCIIHGAGGTYLQHLKELALHSDLRSNERLCFFTTCGWMMWNWMVSALSLGTTLVLYEGSPAYPDSGRLFQLIEQENINVFGTSARFLSAVEKAGIEPMKNYDLASLRLILSTGSPLLHKNYDFVYQSIKSDVQLSSISGGTDIISCFALGCPIKPVYRGELQCLGLGMAVSVFDEAGKDLKAERGELVCTKPFPSMPIGFWNDPNMTKYKAAYFERFDNIWAHGDYAELTLHGGLIIYGRSDAVLNPGGVRIGTAEIYRQLEKIPQILESVVVGQQYQDDERVLLFVKLSEGLKLDETLKQGIRQLIRQNASPRHVPAKIIQVDDIPKTINGKIVEVAVKKVIHGETVNNLDSLANPEALQAFASLSLD